MGYNNRLYCLRRILDFPDQQLEESFLVHFAGIFVRYSIFFVRNNVIQVVQNVDIVFLFL